METGFIESVTKVAIKEKVSVYVRYDNESAAAAQHKRSR